MVHQNKMSLKIKSISYYWKLKPCGKQMNAFDSTKITLSHVTQHLQQVVMIITRTPTKNFTLINMILTSPD